MKNKKDNNIIIIGIIFLIYFLNYYNVKLTTLTIERNQHSVIVYDEEKSRGITFPNEHDTDVNLYVAELKERAQVITPGTVLVPLLFDPQYK